MVLAHASEDRCVARQSSSVFRLPPHNGILVRNPGILRAVNERGPLWHAVPGTYLSPPGSCSIDSAGLLTKACDRTRSVSLHAARHRGHLARRSATGRGIAQSSSALIGGWRLGTLALLASS